MSKPATARLDLFVLYVADPLASVAFYQRLLDRDPVAAFPSYAAFALDGGHQLGLWATHRVTPPPPATGHRSELAFLVDDDEAVRDLHARWVSLGVTIERTPYAEVFGLTFVALDPDGHRIRVCPR